jgi:2-dehydro-3-deoxyphosphogluconate aldolase/(4S)-4-hydroxy-2-oxoglutarate aldolase
MLPGVATPTDIELAMSLGLDTVKFFPAETMGGVAAIKALAGPYRNIRFVPTGGITPEKLPSYLAVPCVLACGGSWLAPRERLAAGEFDAIRKLIEQAVGILARNVR